MQESIQRAIDAEERESVQKSLVEQLHNAKQNLLNSLTTAVEGHNKVISFFKKREQFFFFNLKNEFWVICLLDLMHFCP